MANGRLLYHSGAIARRTADALRGLHGDGLDLLSDRPAAHGAQAEFRGTRDAAAVMAARDQRAVDGRIEAHLGDDQHEKKGRRY